MHLKSSFLPVIDRNVRMLILGSLPGELSLAHSEYYAHPQNQFWRLISEIIGINLPPLKYSDRLKTLLANHIGLWDVVAEAYREGSLDSKIRHHANNDLNGLITTLPQLTTIAFNGSTAARLGLKILKDQASQYRIIQLPSSSPAYTLRYAEKLAIWQSLHM
ncbi:DNA-deoxyinosine glycosylase [Glaciimonas sp. GG7]